MLRGGVVEYHVQDYFQSSLMAFPQQLLEIVHVPVDGVDGGIVTDVVSVIGQGRGIYGGEPDSIHTQGILGSVVYVVEVLDYAPEVTDAIAVGIREAPYVYLVYYAPLPPGDFRAIDCRLLILLFKF
jgi:hypothetical protein